MHASKIEIVKKFIDGYNSFNVESMLAYLHPEVEFKNISGGEVNAQTKGREAFKDLANKSTEMFTEREQKVIYYTESDDIVNAEIKFCGKLAIDFPNGLKAGEYLQLNGRSKYVFKDNLIILLVDES